MSLDLTPTLTKALQEQLPAAVGGELQKLLEKAASDREELERLRANETRTSKLHQEAMCWRDESHRFDARKQSLDMRENELVERDLKLSIREATIELRESHAAERVCEMRSVVSDVFSTRYKFIRNTEDTVVLPGTDGGQYSSSTPSMTQGVERKETVEGEGEQP